MNIKCVSNIGYENQLTIDKIYSARERTIDRGYEISTRVVYYIFECDDNHSGNYDKWLF